jgi:N-acetyltransferase 10
MGRLAQSAQCSSAMTSQSYVLLSPSLPVLMISPHLRLNTNPLLYRIHSFIHSFIHQSIMPHSFLRNNNRFCVDFARRFLSLLGGPFRELSCTLSLSIADVAMNGTGNSNNNTIERLPQQERVDARAVNSMFLPHDLKRLDAYARNLVDYHMVADLLPTLAHLFLQDRMPATMSLSPLQRALLIGMGLQGKTVDSMSSEFGMPSTQLLAMFNKSVRKFAKVLREVLESEAGREMDKSEAMKSALKVGGSIRKGKALKPLAMSLEDEQDTDGKVGEAAL